METLTRECRAKINLYLRVVARRSDGFHELDTVFQEIDLADHLCWQPDLGARTLEIQGADLGDPEQNLVLRAIRSFEQATQLQIKGRFSLEKKIPVGGGLGGGSSDAAQTLLMLNEYHGQPLDQAHLASMALALGSDVPFFLRGGCQRGRGRGELLETCSFATGTDGGLLLFPACSIPTGPVFRQLCLQHSNIPDPRLGENDLLEAALAVSPAFAAVWEQIYPCFDAAPFFMTGSGSSMVYLAGPDFQLEQELKSRLEQMEVRVIAFRFVGR